MIVISQGLFSIILSIINLLENLPYTAGNNFCFKEVIEL